MRHTATVLGLMLAALAAAAPATAQSLLHGTVTDTAGRPLAGVDLVLTALGRHTTTGEAGTFRLTLPEGTHQVLVRSVGYRPQRLEYRATGRDTTVVSVVLAVGDVELPPIEVVVRPTPRLSPKRAIFEERRNAHTGGAFIDDSLLRTREHSALSDVLRRIPGTKIVNIKGGRRALASSRGPTPTLKSGVRGAPCFTQVVVDGIRMWSMKDLATREPYDIDQIAVSQIQAIEVYRGAAQTPVELNITGSDCGTIVIWTR